LLQAFCYSNGKLAKHPPTKFFLSKSHTASSSDIPDHF
jgi:hypothetical protein